MQVLAAGRRRRGRGRVKAGLEDGSRRAAVAERRQAGQQRVGGEDQVCVILTPSFGSVLR